MTASNTCITCSRTIHPGARAKCIIHSCCCRPVCPECLQARPRLAFFCVLCEGVHHAFRKGQRHDVTRAGQTIFDYECTEQQQEDEDLPPYTASPFLIEKSPSRPALLNLHSSTLSHSQPSSVHTQGAIDHGAHSSEKQASTSLRHSLASASSRSKVPASPSNSSSKNTSHHTVTDAGLTRQYWLRPNDSIVSLSLRFRVGTAMLCKLNDLPLSTASSTPHLIHTRDYILIPEEAIQNVLSTPDSTMSKEIETALHGPAPITYAQRDMRARRHAHSRFRALVAQNNPIPPGSALTQCDERAARVYISLMESELRDIDLDAKENYDGEADALLDAALLQKYDLIVKQALCRWEMDSDWEREQRVKGIEPSSLSMPLPTSSSNRHFRTTSSNFSQWFQRTSGMSSQHREKAV